jgi:O-antigen ligase
VIGAVLLCFLLLFSLKKTINSIRFFPIYFIVFVILIFLSSISAVFAANNIQEFSTYIKGVVYFIGNSVIPLLVIFALRDFYKPLLQGLAFGFVCNFIFSIMSMVIFYLSGNVVSLFYLFPNNYFYIPAENFRIQGFFLEPSHYMGFLLSVYFLLLSYFRNKAIRICFTSILILSLVFSGSGNILIFLIAFLFLMFVMDSDTKRLFVSRLLQKGRHRILLVSSSVVIIIIIITIFSNSVIQKLLVDAISGMNPFDSGNRERFQLMIAGLYIFGIHPIGVGFNMSGTIIARYFEGAASTTHNYLMQILIELGIPGIALFIASFIRPIWSLVSKESENKNYLLATSVVTVLLVMFLNGTSLTFTYLILAIGYLESYNDRTRIVRIPVVI